MRSKFRNIIFFNISEYIDSDTHISVKIFYHGHFYAMYNDDMI